MKNNLNIYKYILMELAYAFIFYFLIMFFGFIMMGFPVVINLIEKFQLLLPVIASFVVCIFEIYKDETIDNKTIHISILSILTTVYLALFIVYYFLVLKPMY